MGRAESGASLGDAAVDFRVGPAGEVGYVAIGVPEGKEGEGAALLWLEVLECMSDLGGFVGDFDEAVGGGLVVWGGGEGVLFVWLKGESVASRCPAAPLEGEGEPGERRCLGVWVEIVDE